MHDQTHDPSATQIVDAILEKSRVALATRDLDLFAQCFVMPHQIETFEGSRTIETAEQLRATFHNVQKYFDTSAVTQLDRVCVAAEFKDPTTVEATYETRMVSGQQFLERPYPVFVTLRKGPQGWRIVSQVCAIVGAPGLCHALLADLESTA